MNEFLIILCIISIGCSVGLAVYLWLYRKAIRNELNAIRDIIDSLVDYCDLHDEHMKQLIKIYFETNAATKNVIKTCLYAYKIFSN